ncbi:MAG: hypothetical protein FWC22_05660 [Treponema sp.]|nr:hypothetical protein [Treponema sp.]
MENLNNASLRQRKRLFISRKTSAREREKLIYLALENECNTVVFSMSDIFFKNKNAKYIKLIKNHGMHIEAGGRDFSLMLPRKLFFLNGDMFRLEQGRRKMFHHFCPTNPKTIAAVSQNAHDLFTGIMQSVTPLRVFHLLPDEGFENKWCACPACRAFRPCEQYVIAANTVADVLAKFDSEARLGYIDFNTEPDAAGVSPRKNMFSTGTANY